MSPDARAMMRVLAGAALVCAGRARADALAVLFDEGPVKPPVAVYGFRPDGPGFRRANAVAASTWTRCFDGKALGTLTTLSAPPPGERGSELTVLAPKAPFVGAREKAYARDSLDEGALFHPVVLSADGHCANPARWKRAPPSDATLALGRAAFERQALASTQGRDHCGQALPPHAPSDLKLVASYAAADGSSLVTLSAASLFHVYGDAEIPPCDFQALTFLTVGGPGVRPAPRFLGYDLQLIDAGDYGGTGQSALLFYKATEPDKADDPHDGLVLFWANGAEREDLEWRGD